MKIVHYKSEQIINTSGLAKVFIDLIVRYHDPLDFIVNDQDLVFISKFWFSQ